MKLIDSDVHYLKEYYIRLGHKFEYDRVNGNIIFDGITIRYEGGIRGAIDKIRVLLNKGKNE